MTGLFERIVLPVASEEDAETTCDVALDRVADADGRVVAVHVVEKGGGVPDKASVEQREERAADIFSVVTDRCDAAGIPVETKLTYGTNVAEAIFDAADDVDATAIVFSPRSGSRWIQLLTGDVAHTLVTEANRPIIVLPDTEAN
ncbi:universal stress protein [Haladaptatus sp. DYF46]|uniref:universal stress protein n=1 Tax=Haladaptatus sp. DYF46 TaxID=2886041 RepID=UPI001E44B02F|nr:universal stress protein [Haladaptatus sp. DYF46]